MNPKILKSPKYFIFIGLFITLTVLLSIIIVKSSKTKDSSMITPTPSPDDMIIITQTPDSTAKQEMIDQSIEDLSQSENIQKENIKVKSVEEKQWSDASLGCSKPGQMYAQVITGGYLITLEANGQNYYYHTSLKEVTRCN